VFGILKLQLTGGAYTILPELHTYDMLKRGIGFSAKLLLLPEQL
jgi:hypothetical protein